MYLPNDEAVRKEWRGRVQACRNSKKEHVRNTTFKQLHARVARDRMEKRNFKGGMIYTPTDIPFMPTQNIQWYQSICDVPNSELIL